MLIVEFEDARYRMKYRLKSGELSKGVVVKTFFKALKDHSP